MKNMFKLLILAISICFDCFSAAKDLSSKDASATKSAKEISQQKLFDITRNGVVVINVRVHVTVEHNQSKMWSGTGFIVDLKKGLIVTNSHVTGGMGSNVDGWQGAVCSYEIKFGNGIKADASIEYIDPCYDFAILSVNPKDIPSECISLEMCEEEIVVNTSVYAMGNSYGNEFSIYPGIIFDTHSVLWLKVFPEESIQFSGLSVPGSSGSPVFRSDGKIVGLLYGGKFVSGSALNIKYVQSVVKSIQEDKKVKRFFCGFIVDYTSIQDAKEVGVVPTDFAEEYNKKFPEANGKILYVRKCLSAFKDDDESEGLKSGDVLVSIKGTDIACYLQKFDEIIQKSQGEPIEASVYRNKELIKVKIFPKVLFNSDDMKLLSFAGATFFEMNDDVKVINGEKENGVYTASCETGSAFPFTGYDLIKIIEINGHKVSTLKELLGIIPNIIKGDYLKISYIRMVGGDKSESTIFSKYSSNFEEAALYTFNPKTKSWDIKKVGKPKSHDDE